MAQLDPRQVPALVHTAFSTLPASAALRVPVIAPATLAELLPMLAYGKEPRERAVQLLLTRRGLIRLGVAEAEIEAVSKELLLGVRSLPSRQRLGDIPPATDFDWDDRDHDALLLLYGPDAEAIDALMAALPDLDEAVSPALPSYLPQNGREPFGFRDGISTFRLTQEPQEPNQLPFGEVILGQPDLTGEAPRSTELGDDGTLVAVLELHQDVQAFWSYWLSQGKGVDEAVLLASKGVGRWPNGMPLIPGQRTEPPLDEAALEIRSFAADPRGAGCPFGAHVRRANPRDTLVPDPELSRQIAQLHQFLRRGRLFGPPAPRSVYPEPLRQHMPDGAPEAAEASRGLFFVALASNLRRQLEFNVQNWLHAPKHGNLWDEVDPVLGRTGSAHRFSIPTGAVARHLDGIGDWVHPRGGGYYLLPSCRAVERLARGWRTE
jgi:deferrochelatase/peroxidase EfeB